MIDSTRVLIVEDDPVSQILLKKMVLRADSDAEIVQVTSAEEAMALVMDSNRFDLIISDNQLMGSQTGLELFRACQMLKMDSQFILISGSDVQRLDQGEAAPIYFAKPVSPIKFQKTIEKLLFGFDASIFGIPSTSIATSEKRKPHYIEWAMLVAVVFAALAATISEGKFGHRTNDALNVKRTAASNNAKGNL